MTIQPIPKPSVSIPAQAFVDCVSSVAFSISDLGYRSVYINTARQDAVDMRTRSIAGRRRESDLSVLEAVHVIAWLDRMLDDTAAKIRLSLGPLIEPRTLSADGVREGLRLARAI